MCPAQWQGETENGEVFYAQYRHGLFYATVNDKIIYEIKLSNDDNGCMGTSEMLRLIGAEIT
jgi:hypothetical protein